MRSKSRSDKSRLHPVVNNANTSRSCDNAVNNGELGGDNTDVHIINIDNDN